MSSASHIAHKGADRIFSLHSCLVLITFFRIRNQTNAQIRLANPPLHDSSPSPDCISPCGWSWAASWNKSITIKSELAHEEKKKKKKIESSIALRRHGRQFRKSWNSELTIWGKAVAPEHLIIASQVFNYFRFEPEFTESVAFSWRTANIPVFHFKVAPEDTDVLQRLLIHGFLWNIFNCFVADWVYFWPPYVGSWVHR